MDERMDLAYRVLDDQLVDADGRRCGRVDDLEFTGGPGDELYLSAILAGRGVWPARLPRPLRRLGARWLGPLVWGSTARRVPWEEVEEVTARVVLRGRAEDLGLAGGDLELAPIVGKLPGA
jgi:sporulation protein YlmC with PRC-barrel domain